MCVGGFLKHENKIQSLTELRVVCAIAGNLETCRINSNKCVFTKDRNIEYRGSRNSRTTVFLISPRLTPLTAFPIKHLLVLITSQINGVH